MWVAVNNNNEFPISRDPPEGGTGWFFYLPKGAHYWGFQFLGIPPKGELVTNSIREAYECYRAFPISRDPPEGGTSTALGPYDQTVPGFQFLGIPPKGEHLSGAQGMLGELTPFPISRDPPEGGTPAMKLGSPDGRYVSNF